MNSLHINDVILNEKTLWGKSEGDLDNRKKLNRNNDNSSHITQVYHKGLTATLAHIRAQGYHTGDTFWVALGKSKGFGFMYFLKCRLGANNFEAQETRLSGLSHGHRQFLGKHSDGYEYIARRQAAESLSVFFVPNQCGEETVLQKDVVGIRACFGEWDDLPLPEQHSRLQHFVELGLVPSSQTFSGNKSIQFYFKIVGACSVARWKYLQRQIAVLFESDPKLTNTNRLMRLAGFDRPNGKHQELLAQTEQQFTEAELGELLDKIGQETKLIPYGFSDRRDAAYRAATTQEARRSALTIPEEELSPPPKPYKPQTRTIDQLKARTGLFPLLTAASRSIQVLVDNGSTQGHRDSECYRVVMESVGDELELKRLGIPFSGNALDQIYQFCDRCQPAFPREEGYEMYTRAIDSSPTASLPSQEIMKRVIRWVSPGNLEQWKADIRAKQARMSSLERFNIIEINQRFISDDSFLDLEEGSIHAYLTPPATGKTTALKRLIVNLQNSSVGSNIATYRNSLGRQVAASTGCLHTWGYVNLDEDGGVINDSSSQALLQGKWQDPRLTAIFSIESIDKFPPKDYLILEEADKVIKALMTSSTCEPNQRDLVEKFRRMVKAAKYIILLDADIDALSIKYIERISGKKVTVHRNKFTFSDGWQCHFYQGSLNKNGEISEHSAKQAEEDIFNDAQQNKKLIVVTDSIQKQVAIEKQYTEMYGADTVLNVNRETVKNKDKRVESFMANPAKFIKKNSLRLVMLSPTCESSLDIVLPGYFDKCYGLFNGTIDHLAARQMLSRLRDNACPRWIFCVPYAYTEDKNKNYHHSPDPDKVLAGIERDFKFKVINLGFVDSGVEDDGTDQGWRARLVEICDLKSGEWSSPEILAFAEYTARVNYSKANLRNLLIESLEDIGHHINLVECDRYCDPSKTKFSDKKEEYKKEYVEAILTADEVPLETATENNKKPEATMKEEYELKRAFWSDQLPNVSLKSELIYKLEFDRTWFKGLQKRAKINNMSKAFEIEVLRGKKYFREASRAVWDLKTDAPLLKLSEAFKLPELFATMSKPGFTWNKNSEIVRGIFELANSDKVLKEYFERGLQIKVSRKIDPCQFLNSILDKFAYKVKVTQPRVNGKQIREYSIDQKKSFGEGATEVYEAILARMNKSVEQEGEEEQTLEAYETLTEMRATERSEEIKCLRNKAREAIQSTINSEEKNTGVKQTEFYHEEQFTLT